ncbi:MAG: transcription antitermination factor NusB [Bacteroidales bacterium]|nr:transcription antitermination factor NusB [Bacteroidales bacterium]
MVKEKEYFCTFISGSLLMISRRLLRIKALMVLYAYNRREDDDPGQAEKELMFSITKTYDLYHLLLMLVVEIADIASEKIDQALQKRIPTPEDLNPNRRFIDNAVVSQLRNNTELQKYISGKKLSWANYRHIPRLLYNRMTTWDVYNEYMKAGTSEYSSDKKYIMRLISDLFVNSEDLNTCLEEQSIYWNDDMEYVMVMIEKTLKKFKPGTGEKNSLMPLFKNEEDEEFVRMLFRKAVVHASKCSELIDNNTTNWEVERIALMDILVMRLAITEILEFSEIPVKVTLNEYIEIAKYYCTSKSSTFVNGILDNIVKEIRELGLVKKQGRGLVGEVITSNNN